MFSPTSTATFFQTIGADKTLVTIHITEVDQTIPESVHAVASVFMLFKDNIRAETLRAGEFTWQGDIVYQAFIVRHTQLEDFYLNAALALARFGISTLTRVTS